MYTLKTRQLIITVIYNNDNLNNKLVQIDNTQTIYNFNLFRRVVVLMNKHGNFFRKYYLE